MFERWATENPDSFAARKYRLMKQTSNADKMWNSIMEFGNQGLDMFDYKEYESIWDEAESIDIARLGHEKMVLFVNSSDNDTSMHVMSNLFNTQVMQVLIAEADKMADGRLPVPCRLVLDDFAAAVRIVSGGEGSRDYTICGRLFESDRSFGIEAAQRQSSIH